MERKLNTESAKSIFQKIKNESILLTGIKSFDDLTGGLKKGQLIVIGGRSGKGKTELALKILYHLIINQECVLYYYSLELSKKQLIERFMQLQNESAISILPYLSPVYVCDNSAVSIPEIEQDILNIKSGSLLRVIFIDYIQLLHNSEERIIWDQLKSMAIKNSLTIIILSQLKKLFDSNTRLERKTEYLFRVDPDPDKIDFVYLIK